MITLANSDKTNRYIFILGDKSDLLLIEKYFNKIPEYMFLKTYTGIPRPVVYIHRANKQDGTLYMWAYAGLWREIFLYCQSANIQVNDAISKDFKHRQMPSLAEFTQIVKNWNLSLDPRDYQIKAAWTILNYRQSLSELATRAGKTLIFYIIARYMTEYCGVRKSLMVVPNVTLVTQGLQDMAEYADFFTGEAVWGGGEEVALANLTIGTYQSLVGKLTDKVKDKKTGKWKPNPKYDPHYYDAFDLICIDECHHLVCNSIERILSQPFTDKCKIMFGFTGTLPKDGTIEGFACHMLMGPTIQYIQTNELVQEGFICNANVTQMQLRYNFNDPEFIANFNRAAEYVIGEVKKENGEPVMLPKEQRRLTINKVKTLPLVVQSQRHLYEPKEWSLFLRDYLKTMGSQCLQVEQLTACLSEKRYNNIYKIINNESGNGILFGNHSEYLEELAQHLREHFPNKEVMVIKGSTPQKKREEIKARMLESNECLVVASYGVLSTGVTLKNINWAILCESFKSEIINKQTIGRGLLPAPGKEFFYIYDLIDVMPTGKLVRHGKAKLKTFKESKFETSVCDVEVV